MAGSTISTHRHYPLKTMDWTFFLIIGIVILVAFFTGLMWLVFKGLAVILKVFYYIGAGIIWLITIPFRHE